jgi:hypothetical protein
MSETHTPPQIIGKFKKWAEERAGEPATVRDTEENGHADILRIEFDRKEKSWIIWGEFFKTFDEAQLAFLYQDKTRTGQSAALTNSSRAT